MKHKGVRASVHHALGAVAMRYPAVGVSVVAALVDLLHRYEHAPGLVADLAAATAERHDDAKLALLLLREVGQVDPAHYKAQEKRDAPGVRNVAAFMCELSSVLPKLVATNVSVLMPHLHGESSPCATPSSRCWATCWPRSTARRHRTTEPRPCCRRTCALSR